MSPMKNQAKFVASIQVFIALCFLFISLLNFASALSFDGLKNDFIADNWGIPLVIFLTASFGLGWWLENVIENITLSKGRKTATLALSVILLAFASIVFGSLVFIPHGFLRSAISATGYILISGFFFRFSVARPEAVDKLQMKS
jgi:hypothetical protein